MKAQAAAFLHQPSPRPWDAALADVLVAETVHAIGQKLPWDRAWFQLHQSTGSMLFAALDRAAQQIDAAYQTQDLVRVAQGCTAWWQAAKTLMDSRRMGWFQIEALDGTLVRAIPPQSLHMDAQWTHFVHGAQARKPPATIWRLVWIRPPQTVVQEQWIGIENTLAKGS